MAKTEPFSMRLPLELKTALKKRADAERRSLTNCIESILWEAVAPPKRAKGSK